MIDKDDDVIKWKYFPRYWLFLWGIHRSPVNSPHKGQWRGALMFSFICAWINGWVNNHEASYLRRHRAHCDVIVMNILLFFFFWKFLGPKATASNLMAPEWRQAITWTNADPVHWHIYAAPRGDELMWPGDTIWRRTYCRHRFRQLQWRKISAKASAFCIASVDPRTSFKIYFCEMALSCLQTKKTSDITWKLID